MGPIAPRVLEAVRCPECWGALSKTDTDHLRCARGHSFGSSDGYLDLRKSLSEATLSVVDSFGYQWNAFSQTNDEDEKFWWKYFQDVPFDELQGALALDAGCGQGRYSRFTAPYVGHLVAVDGSSSVDAAVRNLADATNASVIRADLTDAPFRDEAFDFIFCLGVLHHLPQPQQGLSSLLRTLKPDGLMLLYLYSRPDESGLRRVALAVAGGIRPVTARMPYPLLRWACAPISVGLYVLFVLPGRAGEKIRIRLLAGLPLQSYRGKSLRSLWVDTFDRLSAQIEHRYTRAELLSWFRREHVEVEALREDAGWFVVLRKKAS